MRPGRWWSTLALLSAMEVMTACSARQLPRATPLAAGAAPIPLQVMVCPGADRALGRLLQDKLFTGIELAENYPANAPAPDLVIVGAASRYRRELFEKPVPTVTRVTEVFSIISLGVLPTYVPHQGEASVTFRRPASAASPCAASDAGAPSLELRATPKVREYIAFWFFVPAVIAALPRWEFAGGDGLASPVIDPTEWLAATVYERRLEILRFARP